MIDFQLTFSIFLGAFSALILRDYLHARRHARSDHGLKLLQKQFEESLTVQSEIRQYLAANKNAVASSNVLAEEILARLTRFSDKVS
ncbi:MAG: hypothetical protein AB8B86_18310 [Pseudomonadales bacterium]